ncbi:MAG TPA: hypothetical protein VF375_09090 [Candidatus Limnocylindrales bacterium]
MTSVLVVVVFVLAVAMLAVNVVDVPGVVHGRVPATRSVDVHVAGVRLVDVVRTVVAVLDGIAGPMVEMPVVEEVLVLTVADDGVAAQLVVDVRMLGRGIGSRGHEPMIGLPARESRGFLSIAA